MSGHDHEGPHELSPDARADHHELEPEFVVELDMPHDEPVAGYAPAAHYDRVTEAWGLLLGAELHYGYFETGAEELAMATAALTDRMIAAAYLRPGLPFGGACLTKDVSSLAAQAREKAVSAPLIANILASNGAHVEHFVQAVLQYRPRRVAVLGIGFKPGAADVRDSGTVRIGNMSPSFPPSR